MIPLGAFELQSRLGNGGMGEVWRGVHRAQHVPVAVKLLTMDLARKKTFRAAFRNEVRAVAGLDHPNIVLVFDYGTVDEATQRASGGALRVGTPWLAMELAEDGSLENRRLVRSWPQLRGVLLALLDALAHAHARGVVHRDIKPGNVLVAKGRTLKLTDFGLAHAMDKQDGDFVAGTPSYMAPEQFEGRWRDYGPWTDLYAVGCLTYALCAGTPPFGMIDDWHTGLALHRDRPPPGLVSRFRVPAAFEAWVARLLHKDPRDRWRRCADAAAALLQLPDTVPDEPLARPLPASDLEATVALAGGGPAVDPDATRTLPGPRAGVDVPGSATVPIVDGLATPLGLSAPPRPPSLDLAPQTWTLPVGQRPAETGPHEVEAQADAPPTGPMPPVRAPLESEVGGLPDGVDAAIAPVAVPGAGLARPPLPASWRRPEPPARSPRLVGAGLGLFGLRAIPLVGRRIERDALWDALTRVEQTGLAHVVVVHGPAGCGKSRLARWVGERAHEVGAASVLSAAPQPGASAEDVLASLLLDWLRCRGLDRAEVAERVSAQLASVGVADPVQWSRALGLLLGGQPIAERRRGLVELLVQLTAERPLVVCVDDAHLEPALLELPRMLLDAPGLAPILWVTAVSDEARTTRGAVSSRLDVLKGHRRVRGLALGPLAEAHRAELVRQLLGLEGPLAVEVERRTGGHPLYAVQLVGDWVQRGLLEPGRRGFRLKDGALPEVPDDLRQVWAERVERYLRARPFADAVALELAAVLGHDVRVSEWAAVCEQAGVRSSGDLVEDLLALHLARCGPEGPQKAWSFTHGLVREALEARARAEDRLVRHHARCAAVLADREGRGVAERLARHLIAAGHPGRAIGPLLEAIDERLALGEHAAANALLSERDQALHASEAPEMSHAEGWIRWGRLASRLGRLGDARLWAEQAIHRARTERWGRVLVDGLLLHGAICRRQGDTTAAWRLLFEAEQLAAADPTRWRLGLARLELGRLQAQRGSSSRAVESFQEARADLEAAGDLEGIGAVFLELARISFQRGRAGASRVLLDWAHGRYRWLDCRLGLARTRLLASRVARLDGRLDEAADAIHDATDDFRSLGSDQVYEAELELGLLARARGELADARDRASHALRHWDIEDERPNAARAHALLLAVAAESGDAEAVNHHFERLERLVAETGLVDRDLEHLANAAANRLLGDAIARKLRVLAEDQRTARLMHTDVPSLAGGDEDEDAAA